MRLDAIARYLQDVASDDAIDAGLSNALGWVVRRTMIRIDRPLTVGEPLSLVTFCTGTGRSWAERRTTIADQHGAAVEAVSVWVHVDPDSGRPARLGHDFAGIYGAAAAGRTVSSRLPLASVTSNATETMLWTFRRTDLDPFGHVNNAAHWAVLEQLLQSEAASRVGVGEIDFVAPAEADTPMKVLSRRNGGVDARSRRSRAVVGGRRSRRHGPSLDAVRAAGVNRPPPRWTKLPVSGSGCPNGSPRDRA